MKLTNRNQICPKYWHKQSKEVRQRINESPDSDQLKRNLFKQPKWCLKPDANVFHVKDGKVVSGCTIMELQPNLVSNRKCMNKKRLEGTGICPFHICHPTNILLRPIKRRSKVNDLVNKDKSQKSYPNIVKYSPYLNNKSNKAPVAVRKAKSKLDVLYKVSAILVAFYAVGYFGYNATGIFHYVICAAIIIAFIPAISSVINWISKKF